MFFGKPIIVCYPRGTGGKFLINCLGLSDDVLLSDFKLAQRQLNNQLTPSDKLDLLLDRLSTTSAQNWNDLDLSHVRLFDSMSLLNTFSNEEKEKFSGSSYTSVIDPNLFLNTRATHTIINSNKAFGFESHGLNEAEFYYNLWDDATMILFDDNFNLFYQYRTPYSMYKNIDWEFNKVKLARCLFWSADAFLHEDTFLTKIEELYKNIGLSGFNKDYVSAYRSAWLDTIRG